MKNKQNTIATQVESNFKEDLKKLFHPKFSGDYERFINEKDYNQILVSLNEMRKCGDFLISSIVFKVNQKHYEIDFSLKNDVEAKTIISKTLITNYVL